MPALLLDENISPEIVDVLRARQKDIVITSLADWENGRFLGLPDEAILREAAIQALTLVTYDRKTIPPLLKLWAEIGRDHGGVIFIDQKTIRSSDFGGTVRSLQKLYRESARWNWKNRISFLRR